MTLSADDEIIDEKEKGAGRGKERHLEEDTNINQEGKYVKETTNRNRTTQYMGKEKN
jgi:hypothetical protein